jgi:putative zinc finger protein
MSAQMNDHQEAVKNLMAERYLLGELDAVEREAYEEHLFSCDACFEQVKAGTEFVSHLRQIGVEDPQPAVAPGFLARLIAGLRQPVTIAACALLACVSGLNIHQREIIAGLRKAQVTPSVFLSDGAKAGGIKQIVVPANGRFAVDIQVVQDESFNSYEGQVLTESQHLKESFPISAEQTKETIHVQLDSGIEGPGNYFMVVNGLTPDGRKIEVTRYKFQVLLKE